MYTVLLRTAVRIPAPKSPAGNLARQILLRDSMYFTLPQVHNALVTDSADRYPELDAAVQNASSPHYSSATTAYTGLISLDDDTLLLSYDRLANGWLGPPGKMGDSDKVFTMVVKITPKGSTSV